MSHYRGIMALWCGRWIWNLVIRCSSSVLTTSCISLVLQIFGIASVAQMVLSNWKFGNFFSVNFGWGIGVTLGCYWAGGVSGTYNRIWLCQRAAPDPGGTVSRENKETLEYVLNFEFLIRELKPSLYFKLNERFLLCYSWQLRPHLSSVSHRTTIANEKEFRVHELDILRNLK